jgi:hypothetical protein
MDLETLARELDERHGAARIAFRERDPQAYREIFSPGLAYRQPNGLTIGRDALIRDVDQQLRRLLRADSTFERTALEGSDAAATEVLVQTASAEAVAFALVRRRWVLRRHATYHWVRAGDAWVVQAVEVASEAVTHAGWAFGPGRASP